MDREEMISFIIEGELKMMDAFKKGHKPHTEAHQIFLTN
jgi:hypothetical protein